MRELDQFGRPVDSIRTSYQISEDESEGLWKILGFLVFVGFMALRIIY
jgi:hypothetical protein